MAIAWLLSVCYVKFKDLTFAFLQNHKLDDFILNKTISKICDSYRVLEQDKLKIKQLRVKKLISLD
jgi:3-methyladenine DNA glycosylase AlkD